MDFVLRDNSKIMQMTSEKQNERIEMLWTVGKTMKQVTQHVSARVPDFGGGPQTHTRQLAHFLGGLTTPRFEVIM